MMVDSITTATPTSGLRPASRRLPPSLDPGGSRRGFLARWKWPLLAVAALAVAVIAWTMRGGDSVSYRTTAAERGTVRVAIAATGKLSALSTVEIGAQVSGQVLTVEVDYNDQVTAGQAIAHIDPANFRSRLDQVQAELTSSLANLESARANLGEAQATLRNAEANFQRAESIFERKLISRADYDATVAARDQALARVASASASIRVAQSQVEQRRAAVQNAQLDLDYTTIRSPVDGVVLLRSVEPGQTVASSFQTPVLFSIAEDLGKMQIELTVDESDVGQIRAGQDVRFTVDAFPGRDFAGKVRQVRLAATETSTVVTYPVIVDVDNRDGLLLPGMTANTEVLVSERTDVLRLANAALRYRPANAPASANTGTATGGPPSAEMIARFRAQAEQQQRELANRLQLNEAQRQQLAEAMSGMRQRTMSGGAQGAGGQGSGLSEDVRRRRAAEAMASALQPLRADLGSEQQALLDQELALMANSRRSQVWVLRGGIVVETPVRIGLADASYSEILSGLAEGDQVVTGVERGG